MRIVAQALADLSQAGPVVDRGLLKTVLLRRMPDWSRPVTSGNYGTGRRPPVVKKRIQTALGPLERLGLVKRLEGGRVRVLDREELLRIAAGGMWER
jgi:hypothetical protein